MLKSPFRFSSLRKILFTLSNKVIVWLFTLFRVQNYKKLSTPPKLRFKLYAFATELYRRNWCFPTIWLTLLFDFSHASLRFDSFYSAIELKQSFDFTELPSPQRLHGEPSPSQRRRLAKSMASLRQLVESKGTVQSVHKYAFNDPLKRFRESAHVHQTRWFCLTEVESKKRRGSIEIRCCRWKMHVVVGQSHR